MFAKTFYSDRPERIETHSIGNDTVLFVRQNITETEDGFSAEEFSRKFIKEAVDPTEDWINEFVLAETEKVATAVREQRNRLLDETDMYMVSDRPTDKEAWREYRQMLRDIPEQEGFPLNVDWPERPEV